MNHKQFQKHCEMQANWWMSSAITGHALSRKQQKRVDGEWVELTDQEKINSAMQIAQNHIHLFRESCEKELTQT